jgi:hypothetical protein
MIQYSLIVHSRKQSECDGELQMQVSLLETVFICAGLSLRTRKWSFSPLERDGIRDEGEIIKLVCKNDRLKGRWNSFHKPSGFCTLTIREMKGMLILLVSLRNKKTTRGKQYR